MATHILTRSDGGAVRFFLTLSYRGAPFHGWQVQPGAVSVQEVIEDSLMKLTGSRVAVTGAGRTDAGVNARMMVAHADIPPVNMSADALLRGLNALCGPDIAVHSVTPVHSDAHARFDATSRTYRYYATERKNPFFHWLSWQCGSRLDFEAMNAAAATLPDVSDFASFAKLHSDARTTICHVSRACWIPVDHIPGAWYFEITADRFLRNMVRAVVGTLVEVGRGKLSLDGFRRVVEARDRCAAGTSMPPQALYLWDVGYPYFDANTATYTPII